MSEQKVNKYVFAYYGNPILRKKAKKVTKINNEIIELCENLTKIMLDVDGLGLAAPQISNSYQIIAINMSAVDENLPQNTTKIFINPEIIEEEGEQIEEEGCLSIPKIYEKVKRPFRVKVKYLDLDGEEHVIDAIGLLARVFSHEIDHLNGILFIDRISEIKRNLLSDRLEKIIKEYNK